MKDKWKEASDRASSGSSYIRLRDSGDSCRVVVVGDPEITERVWANGAYEEYDPSVHAGVRPITQFVLRVFDLDDQSVKQLTLNKSTFTTLLKCREKYGFDKWSIEITRSGQSGDQRTSYSILPHEQITTELAASIAAADSEGDAPAVIGAAKSAIKTEAKRAPVSPPKSLVDRAREKLASIPRATAMGLLKDAGVGKVSELDSAGLESLIAHVDSLDELPF